MIKQKCYSKFLILGICLILCCAYTISCNSTNKVKKNFLGIWDVEKIVTSSTVVTFGEVVPSVLVMEMSIQFNDDNTYIIHYYVNGKEGDKYPQCGTFVVEGKTLVLSNGAIASITEDQLVIQTKDGSHQYCSRRK